MLLVKERHRGVKDYLSVKGFEWNRKMQNLAIDRVQWRSIITGYNIMTSCKKALMIIECWMLLLYNNPWL